MTKQTATEDGQTVFGELTYFAEQWSAVSAPNGPVLVLAGPGAGKTRCLIGRIRYLADVLGTPPDRICAVTFTNKAAEEIAGRLRRCMGATAEHPWLGTIHALCLDLLRPFAKTISLPPGFGVADETHQFAILTRLRAPRRRHSELLTLFGRHRLSGYSLTPGDEVLFQAYSGELSRNRLVDFDDIIALSRHLLESDAGVLAGYQARWDHILVDEFQDLDPYQYEILRLLADRHRSLFAVGDDEQSIFTWRGADPSLARRLLHDFEIQAPIVLDINCRCSIPIFETARKVLPKDGSLFEKSIRATRPGDDLVQAKAFESEVDEAAWVTDDLLSDLARSGLPRGEYAILYRRHEMGSRLEQALLAKGIACQLAKGRALADDPVIRQLLSSLRIVLSPNSHLDIEALARSVLPEQLLMRLETQEDVPLFERVAAYARTHSDVDARSCWRLIYQVENLKGMGRVHDSLPDLVDGILALGVGRYVNPLERVLDRLVDPQANPQAVELSDTLARGTKPGGRILVAPAQGLEIPATLMLRRALPDRTVGYLSGCRATPDDLILALSETPPSCPGTVVPLDHQDGLHTTTLFKALQLHVARATKRLLDEYVVFDTETTDKDIAACEVVELAAVRVRRGDVVDQFRTLVRCSRPISPGAAAIHGYKDADLTGQPNMADIWPRFRTFVGRSVLVAHNGYRFDVPVLERLTEAWGGLRDLSVFDSLPLARQLYSSGGLGLEDLASHFGVPTGRKHHALDDCLCLATVIERLLDEHLRQSRMTCLASLLEHVALGAALENPSVRSTEDHAMVESGTWRLFGRYSDLLNGAASEAATELIAFPEVEEIIERLGGKELFDRVRRETSPQDRYSEAYARFRQLVAGAAGPNLEESIRRFLDTAALSRSDGASVDTDRVSLLTFHATKGLEFSRVYVLGVEDYQLPGYRAITEDRVEEIQEARRLLYVAMTRAKDRLVLTYSRTRGGMPSGGTRFLNDMALLRPA